MNQQIVDAAKTAKWKLHSLPSNKMTFTKKDHKMIVTVKGKSGSYEVFNTKGATSIVDNGKFKLSDSEAKLTESFKN